MLSPSGQEVRAFLIFKKLTDVVSCVIDRLWRKEPSKKCLLINGVWLLQLILTFSLWLQAIHMLPWRLADSSTARGLGVSASRLFSWSFVRSKLQDESPEECSTAEAADCVSWGRIRLLLDADKFMSWTEVQHPRCRKSGSRYFLMARTNACGT